MNKKTRFSHFLCLTLLCVIFLCLSVTGCDILTQDGTSPQASDHSDRMLESTIQAEFDEYTEQVFRTELPKNTLNLHYTLAHPENYGITDYPVTLGQFSSEYFAEVFQDLERMKSDLDSFDTSALTESQLLTYDVLMNHIDTELSASDYYLYNEALSSTSGYQAQLPVLFAEYTFRTRRDINNYLTLLSQVDDLFTEIIHFEQEKSAAGLFMADYTADGIIAQCQEFIADPEQNYLIEVFNNKIRNLSGLSEEEKANYIEQNKTLVTTDMVHGYQVLIDGLTGLKGTGKNDLGLCYYKDGTEYYEYLVRTNTGSSASVNELQEETARFIQDSLQELLAIVTDTPQALEAIQSYHFALTDPEDILADLINKISSDFPEPPKVSYHVKYVHPSMEDYLSPAFYLIPPIDDIQNNVIYINGKYEDNNIYPTIAHEGYPGHLYQTTYTYSCDLPLVRNILSYPGYTEGWATYVEYYSYGISGLDPSLAKILQLNNSASLGLYAYIDMAVHYSGWNQAAVQQYLANFGLGDEETAATVFKVMIDEPSNYLSYFIGYLEFLNLKEEAETALGETFSLKDFHTFLLEIGPAPFNIIENRLQAWITAQNGAD